MSPLSLPPVKLTARQQQVLDVIRDAVERSGAPPTRAEIAAQLGFRSVNAAEEHLQALARKGAIELLSGTSRGIRIKSPGGIADRAALLLGRAVAGAKGLSLPLVGRVAAGVPILAEQHIEQLYQVEQSLFRQAPDYLLKVKGMSMRDAGILDGDLLAVASTRHAENGQIIVARIGDEVTVKRFRRSGGRVELLPENPDFPVIQVRPDEPFEIEGRAVGLIRNQFDA